MDISSLISPISSLIGKVIDRVAPDQNEANRMKLEASTLVSELAREELKGAVQVITAEANGESWLQRNWRPMLMLWFAVLVGAHWLGFTPPNLPEAVVLQLLEIVQVGIGGYVLGRSAEKGIKAWKG